ncbi:MAG: GGDEF domain-containing protein [Rhodocyclaceae bacterium]|nr:GGDEF domain-containing protein [Rhodocyclaceae bacterium]
MSRTESEFFDELTRLRKRVAELEALDAERRQIEEALRASKEEYRLLLDESSDPIFTFYRDGRYRYVNRAFADGVGRDMGQIIGRSIWDVFPKAEADRRYATVQWVFEKAETRIIEVRVPRPDGDRHYITTAKPIFDEEGQVDSVICISKDITDRKTMEEKLSRMAQYDLLTDLPNRALFGDRLRLAISQARRERTHMALMILDLDRFKQINDAHGHHVGDLVLRAAALRMQSCIRESDTVARLGGDEFAVLLPHVAEDSDALVAAEKICAALEPPYSVDGHAPLAATTSIGIALYPDHGNEEATLMKCADRAMYDAKAQGRSRAQIYQP